ncbi:hypothetical protein N7495_006192 [Penicillium taxi]|uniref:uncharacterized protein n=1 Tax=Penicillium taxi TaxID=168475 RepID=UPI002544EC5D|nr:uncharacterized protein N7495_006192 [Penicillium taxi]KAJ5894501.1 hypothetical protein N7495_006192 [Penicillium taxi]
MHKIGIATQQKYSEEHELKNLQDTSGPLDTNPPKQGGGVIARDFELLWTPRKEIWTDPSC